MTCFTGRGLAAGATTAILLFTTTVHAPLAKTAGPDGTTSPFTTVAWVTRATGFPSTEAASRAFPFARPPFFPAFPIVAGAVAAPSWIRVPFAFTVCSGKTGTIDTGAAGFADGARGLATTATFLEPHNSLTWAWILSISAP
ncbi:hypothetical protein HOY82DRAFT_536370 [Tuber indicum]|nr:hypothetical protein HOY82DRAFT_536370 [Tuber indicum]